MKYVLSVDELNHKNTNTTYNTKLVLEVVLTDKIALLKLQNQMKIFCFFCASKFFLDFCSTLLFIMRQVQVKNKFNLTRVKRGERLNRVKEFKETDQSLCSIYLTIIKISQNKFKKKPLKPYEKLTRISENHLLKILKS